MIGAPYEADGVMTDSESFAFCMPYEPSVDGTPISWADYAPEYALSRDGSRVFVLRVGSGVVIDQVAETLTFSNPSAALDPGIYDHSFRLQHLPSGRYFAVFDGRLTVTRSAFR